MTITTRCIIVKSDELNDRCRCSTRFKWESRSKHGFCPRLSYYKYLIVHRPRQRNINLSILPTHVNHCIFLECHAPISPSTHTMFTYLDPKGYYTKTICYFFCINLCYMIFVLHINKVVSTRTKVSGLSTY